MQYAMQTNEILQEKYVANSVLIDNEQILLAEIKYVLKKFKIEMLPWQLTENKTEIKF